MGNLTIKEDVFIYSSHQWQPLPQLNSQQLLLDTQTGIIAQAQLIKNISQQYIDSLQFRVKHNRYLVDVLAIKRGASPNCLSGSTVSCSNLSQEQGITVFIQNITYRLPDLGSLNYAQAIYVLHQCLVAIKVIFEQYPNSCIQFEQEMIGFNKAGKCKFWANVNYFKDVQSKTPNQNSQQSSHNIGETVAALFQCIEQRMNCQLTKSQLDQYLKIKNQTFKYTSFTHSIQFIQNGLRFISLLAKNNKIDLSAFYMRIAELQTTQFTQKISMLISPNKNITTKLTKLNQKNKISLKRRISQDKKYQINLQGLKRQNLELRKRESQTTLFQSMQLSEIYGKQKTNNVHIIINNMEHSNKFKKHQNHAMKFSRSTLMTRDSEYSSMIKYQESPKKVALGLNIRKKITN